MNTMLPVTRGAWRLHEKNTASLFFTYHNPNHFLSNSKQENQAAEPTRDCRLFLRGRKSISVSVFRQQRRHPKSDQGTGQALAVLRLESSNGFACKVILEKPLSPGRSERGEQLHWQRAKTKLIESLSAPIFFNQQDKIKVKAGKRLSEISERIALDIAEALYVCNARESLEWSCQESYGFRQFTANYLRTSQAIAKTFDYKDQEGSSYQGNVNLPLPLQSGFQSKKSQQQSNGPMSYQEWSRWTLFLKGKILYLRSTWSDA